MCTAPSAPTFQTGKINDAVRRVEQSIRSRYPSVRRLYIEANPANAVGRESNSGMHPGTGVDAPGADQQRTGTEEWAGERTGLAPLFSQILTSEMATGARIFR